jgi:hypothetical protein
MEREFLEGLTVEEQPLPGEVVDAILQQHQAEIGRLRLESAVETAVYKAGGRNLKAISALLDFDAIAGAEDMTGALDAALQTLKKENGYLFETPTPPPYARFTGAAQPAAQTPVTLAGALRERMKRN